VKATGGRALPEASGEITTPPDLLAGFKVRDPRESKRREGEE